MQQVVALRLQGGLKAVVWTDTLQQIVMMGSSIIVIGLGIIAVGGLDVMWQRSMDGDRIEFFKYVLTSSGSISNYRTQRKITEIPWMLEDPCARGLLHCAILVYPTQPPLPTSTSSKRLSL
jgi:Na+(H+)/acetate symporter ActP